MFVSSLTIVPSEKNFQNLRKAYRKTAHYARISEVYWKRRMDAGEAPEIFQYFFGQPRKNSVSRARTLKFIGSSGRDFPCGAAYLEQFGLRIMNPPL